MSARRNPSNRNRKTKATDKGEPDITIGELWERLDPNDSAKGSGLDDLPGFRRLDAIVQAEFSSNLDMRTLDMLCGLLSSLYPKAAIDELGSDTVTLSEAAHVLETAARRSPTGRLIDQMPATCDKCGRQLSDEDRAWRRQCEDCRSLEGKVYELDIAFRTESRSYDEYGRDPFDCFPEWPKLSTYICELYNIFKVERDHWERFLRAFQVTNQLDKESLLGMSLAQMVARLETAEEKREQRPPFGFPTEGTKELLDKTFELVPGPLVESLIRFLLLPESRKATLNEVCQVIYKSDKKSSEKEKRAKARRFLGRTKTRLDAQNAPFRIVFDKKYREIRVVRA